MSETVVPGNVPQVVLRVVIPSPPLCVLPGVQPAHQAGETPPVVSAGEGPGLQLGGPGRLGDRVGEAPGHVVADLGEAGPQVGDVELGHVELGVRHEDHHGHGAVPGVRGLHQPVESLH